MAEHATVNKNAFAHKNADPHFHEIQDGKKMYHPFRKEPNSLLHTNLPSVNNGIIPIKEIMYG